ncbi:DeoR/GlpR family DNA-binding transcription regulator [Microlunatus soli]|uniref:DNA-binding transcriptional regulator of sugar metabolism, DeoR/GlpR family n=1 Tax=Microlunatus soli TaxID=630515 RepID=A0A1H1ZNV2_9ACTN|nr:DeoR/GlpR family DNA-binding transcription regulator [Microlunatus soli]SDT35323.1 DNA-binding transcriptional regulator of sugar metabolism, DeoR/GlpR family [Microlunatus soli]
MTQTRDARLAAIVDHLVEVGSEAAKQLAARFDVSVMTVHRDLDELEQRGLVRKFHGGASVTRTGSYEIAAAIRRRLAVAQKQTLANAAAESVRDGQTVMIDDSSTASAMVDPLIRSAMTIQVITNYLPSLIALSRSTRVVAQAIGGEYDRSHESYLGVGAVDAVHALRPDTVFVSSTTADAAGIYHQEERIVTLKQEMLRSARRRVLLLDETKIGASSLYRVCGWEMIDELITTDAAPAEVLAEIDPRVKVTVVALGAASSEESPAGAGH